MLGGVSLKILVFGGARFMGKHLVRSLIKSGHDVTIANRGIISDDFGNIVKRLIVDRGNAEAMKRVLANGTYNIVYDSLAFSSNDVKRLLDNVQCGKYIYISSTAVYNKHYDTKEEEFNPAQRLLTWCDRPDLPYNEVKQQAECAVTQKYSFIKNVAVRFPFVIGTDDYTKRLYFYVDHIVNEKPMYIDNYKNQMAFVRSDEAGMFLAFLSDCDFYGSINGASEQTISLEEIAAFVKMKTGKIPILSDDGDAAPYNGENEYSINIDKAKELGYSFTPLKNWVFELLDFYIRQASLNCTK